MLRNAVAASEAGGAYWARFEERLDELLGEADPAARRALARVARDNAPARSIEPVVDARKYADLTYRIGYELPRSFPEGALDEAERLKKTDAERLLREGVSPSLLGLSE